MFGLNTPEARKADLRGLESLRQAHPEAGVWLGSITGAIGTTRNHRKAVLNYHRNQPIAPTISSEAMKLFPLPRVLQAMGSLKWSENRGALSGSLFPPPPPERLRYHLCHTFGEFFVWAHFAFSSGLQKVFCPVSFWLLSGFHEAHSKKEP